MARVDRLQRLEQLRYQRREVTRASRGGHPRSILISLIVFGLPFVVSGYFAFGYLNRSLTEPRIRVVSIQHVVSFEVKSGDTVNSVADRLAARGIILNATSFALLARFRGLDSNLAVGVYKVHTQEGLDRMITDLTPTNTTNTTIAGASALVPSGHVHLTIPEGFRIEEIAQLLQKKKVTSAKTFIYEARHGKWDLSVYTVLTGRPADASLEGYLFPETYDFNVYTDTVQSARQAIGQMLLLTQARVTSNLVAAFKKEFKTKNRGLALYKGLTMASLIQHEAQVPREFPKVAAVYINRITVHTAANDTGGFLGVDAAQRYALGYDKIHAWWWSAITPDAYNIATPYNTFNPRAGHPGLPYGPIGNSGLLAITAAAHPEQDWPYFYYIAKEDGTHTHAFAKTNNEFNALKCSLGYRC